jgi:hypothetical protein
MWCGPERSDYTVPVFRPARGLNLDGQGAARPKLKQAAKQPARGIVTQMGRDEYRPGGFAIEPGPARRTRPQSREGKRSRSAAY